MAQRKNKLKIALIYDFDGTLSPLNMQEYDFLKSLHIEKDAFWAETNELVKKKNANNKHPNFFRSETKKNINLQCVVVYYIK